jgi:hypothetical protein
MRRVDLIASGSTPRPIYTRSRTRSAVFSEKDLKTFITNFGVATAEDVKTIKGNFARLTLDGAQRKLAERRPH